MVRPIRTIVQIIFTVIRTNGRRYTAEHPQIAYWLISRQPLFSTCVVMVVVRGWGQIIVVKLFLSPPNTPFLHPVPIINHTFIMTNCYTWKLCFIFVTNIVLRSFNNVGGSSAVWKECTNAPHPTKPRARFKIFTYVDLVYGVLCFISFNHF